MRRACFALLCLLCLVVPLFAVAAQQSATGDVDTMLRQARDEIRDFEKAGGKKDDPNHPIAKWVNALWAFRETSPRTGETAKATSEAVHLLIHADRFQEAQAEEQLDGWNCVPSAWPVDRDFDTFIRWFEYRFHSVIIDLCDDPVNTTNSELCYASVWAGSPTRSNSWTLQGVDVRYSQTS